MHPHGENLSSHARNSYGIPTRPNPRQHHSQYHSDLQTHQHLHHSFFHQHASLHHYPRRQRSSSCQNQQSSPVELHESQRQIATFYQEVIQETIEKCSHFHNPKVMSAIEKNWKQSLYRRLNDLQKKKAEMLPKQKTSCVPNEKTNMKDDVLSRIVARTAGTAPSFPSSAELSFIPSSDVSSSSHGTKDNDIEPKRRRVDDEDDEFADADVDDAEQIKQVHETVNVQSPGKLSLTNTDHKFVRSKQIEGDTSTDADLDLDEVSDLDDQEYPTDDSIFSHYEKVVRCSSGGKHSNNWKILLRHGIMKVGNTEIAFDRLYGELKF